jgi:hypothetical protein
LLQRFQKQSLCFRTWYWLVLPQTDRIWTDW